MTLSTAADALSALDAWPVPHAAAQLLGPGPAAAPGTGAAPGSGDNPDHGPGAVLAEHGDCTRASRIASVSKLLTAYAIVIGVTEGAVELDEPAGPPGATLRHLLAHAAGYGFESDAPVVAAPGTRRIYSNRGIEEAAAHLERAAGVPFPDYLREAVLEPLGMADTVPDGSPAFGFVSTVADLGRFARELLAPRLLTAATLAELAAVQFPGLVGLIPGVGRFDPCDWGLGFERNFGRPGHWSGSRLSTGSFGHFGGAGSFLWVDPIRRIACACLTGREFGPWALEVWPALCDTLAASTP